MHSIKDIINNQKEYGDLIRKHFIADFNSAKKDLSKINSSEKFIIEEKDKLFKKFKNINPKPFLNKLFFMHSKRNKEFYIWWDKKNKEIKILKYEKK